jgi:hypothetical protein
MRPALLLLALAATSSCAPSLPEGVTGEVVTEDGKRDVPCLLRLWRGAIRPLDGRGDPLASARVASGKPFEAALRPTGASDPGTGSLWLTVECDGYFVKVRGVEWSGPRRLLPAVDVGPVWVPKRKS